MALTVVFLLQDADARNRLARAVRAQAAEGIPIHAVGIPNWEELLRLLMAPGEPVLVVVDPYREGRLALTECVTALNVQRVTGVLVYSRFEADRVRDLLRLSQAGVENIVIQDQEDNPENLRDAVSRCRSRSVLSAGWPTLHRITPDPLHSVVEYAVTESYRPVQPAELARVFSRHPKTLREHLKKAALPPTEKLIGWARLFHAVDVLARGSRSADSVAFALRYPSPAALRRQLFAYTGLTPRAVVDLGGLPHLLEAFGSRHASNNWTLLSPRHPRRVARESAGGPLVGFGRSGARGVARG